MFLEVWVILNFCILLIFKFCQGQAKVKRSRPFISKVIRCHFLNVNTYWISGHTPCFSISKLLFLQFDLMITLKLINVPVKFFCQVVNGDKKKVQIWSVSKLQKLTVNLISWFLLSF